jgi:minor extracellular serine protease Vpr
MKRIHLSRFFLLIVCSLFLTTMAFAQAEQLPAKMSLVFYRLVQENTTGQKVRKSYPADSTVILEKKTILANGRMLQNMYSCIIYTDSAASLQRAGFVIESVFPHFATAWLSVDQFNTLAALPYIKFIEAPVASKLHNDISAGVSGAKLLHAGALNNTPYKGKGVIVAIFDTGIDWAHLDFRDPANPAKSRILRIWDQTLSALSPGEAPPSGFSYGIEYTQAEIEDELDGSPAGLVRENDINGHGTHVAGTAAGNGASLNSRIHAGLAPEADIVVVKGGNGSFTSTNQINALTYLRNLSTTLGKPIVLNMSIGGLSGPHDGTLSNEVAINTFTASGPGRVAVISAGNDNGSSAHNKLTIPPNGAANFTLTVPGGTLPSSGTAAASYRFYLRDASNITASITGPAGTVSATAGNTNTGAVSTGVNAQVSCGIETANGNRYADVIVYTSSASTNAGGFYTIELTNNAAAAKTGDGWVYSQYSGYSSYVALSNGDNDYLTGSPGNASNALTVAAYTARRSWHASNNGNYSYTYQNDAIAGFSSNGPRADGVQKPEIAASGNVVISALSQNVSPGVTNIVNNYYQVMSGTSMASPGVAGAVALLLQVNPSLTYAQVKTAITNTAGADAITGTTPNTVWGYGRLDIFKAAASLGGCTPVDRTTYRYDDASFSSQENNTLFNTSRVAVRVTTQATGKFGGVLLYLGSYRANTVVEVRTGNAGSPGTLLGTLNVDSTSLLAYSWNYVDLSSLNLTATPQTDYFVVLYRNSNTSNNWSLVASTGSGGRSYLSSDNGGSWIPYSRDLKIRAVLYNNGQLTGTIASATSAATHDVNSGYQFRNSACELISQWIPTQIISGNATGKVWLETSVPNSGGDPFAGRHFEIFTASNSDAVTGRITLYFKQAEFNAYNTAAGSAYPLLPTGGLDAAGIANIRIGQYRGTSSNSTGLPSSYTGTPTIINPNDADIVYNTDAGRWEVSFNATGLGGFVLQTKTTALPIVLEYFNGYTQGTTNLLNWKAYCTTSPATFEIQRSTDALVFTKIGTVQASLAACGAPFRFTDAAPAAGNNYYRLIMTETATGKTTISNTILLQNDRNLFTTVSPTILKAGGNIRVHLVANAATIVIYDVAGRTLLNRRLQKGSQTITLPVTAKGACYYRIFPDDATTPASGKLIIE